MAQDISAFILADHRESNGANPYLQSAVDRSNAVNTKLPWKSGGGNLMFQIVNNGAIGDYSIMIPSRYNPNRNIVAAVFERKTWKDLAASIKDQRAISQHKNMLGIRDSRGCFIYYIIEGNLTYTDDYSIAHIPFKNLHAKIRSMSLKGVHSWQTRDQEDTARFLVNVARDISRLYRQESISFPLQETPTINIFKQDLEVLLRRYKDSTDPDISRIIANLGSDHNGLTDRDVAPAMTSEPVTSSVIAGDVQVPTDLTKRTESSHTDIIMNMWCAVPKVSNKTAPVLMEHINLIDLICATDTTQITKTISNMTFASGIHFGPVRANAVVSIAYEGDDPGLTSEAHDAHIRILSQIPGVSVETAGLILAQCGMKALCRRIKSLIRTDSNETEKNLRSVVNQLAGIAKRNGSKVGLSTAQKIVDILVETPKMSELNHLV